MKKITSNILDFFWSTTKYGLKWSAFIVVLLLTLEAISHFVKNEYLSLGWTIAVAIFYLMWSLIAFGIIQKNNTNWNNFFVNLSELDYESSYLPTLFGISEKRIDEINELLTEEVEKARRSDDESFDVLSLGHNLSIKHNFNNKESLYVFHKASSILGFLKGDQLKKLVKTKSNFADRLDEVRKALEKRAEQLKEMRKNPDADKDDSKESPGKYDFI